MYQFTHWLALKLYPQQIGTSFDLRLYLSRLEIHDSETCEKRHAFGANKSCCCRQVISIYLQSKVRTCLKMWQECHKLTPCPAISKHTVAGAKPQARTEPKNRMCFFEKWPFIFRTPDPAPAYCHGSYRFQFRNLSVFLFFLFPGATMTYLSPGGSPTTILRLTSADTVVVCVTCLLSVSVD